MEIFKFGNRRIGQSANLQISSKSPNQLQISKSPDSRFGDLPVAKQPHRGARWASILGRSRNSREEPLPRLAQRLSDERPRDSLEWDFYSSRPWRVLLSSVAPDVDVHEPARRRALCKGAPGNSADHPVGCPPRTWKNRRRRPHACAAARTGFRTERRVRVGDQSRFRQAGRPTRFVLEPQSPCRRFDAAALSILSWTA